MKKQEKGITLIALIITIVVLLILAVVSIKAVQDGGIITHAQNAASKMNKAQIEEQANLTKLEYTTECYTNKDLKKSVQELRERLIATFEVTGDTNNDNIIEVNDKYAVVIKNTNLDIEVVEIANVIKADFPFAITYTVNDEKEEDNVIYTGFDISIELLHENLEAQISLQQKEAAVVSALGYDTLDGAIVGIVNSEYDASFENIDSCLEGLTQQFGATIEREHLYYAFYYGTNLDSDNEMEHDEFIVKAYTMLFAGSDTSYTTTYKIYSRFNGQSEKLIGEVDFNDQNPVTFNTKDWDGWIAENSTYELIIRNTSEVEVAREKIEVRNIVTSSTALSKEDAEGVWTTDGAGTITAYTGSESNVTIPKIIGTEVITTIGEKTFYENENITSVTIPDTVTSIWYAAFYKCSKLTNVTIPSSVTTIGNSAFSNCESITNLTIPEGVKTIGRYAFNNCTSLESITIPSTASSTGWLAFTKCTNLKSVTISEGVRKIEDNSFWYCTSLTDVKIPDSVTSVGEDAFRHCTSLASISIPSSVTSIGEWAFASCESLASITIPEKVTSIEKGVFYNCKSLTNVQLQSAVKSIGERAFEECTTLASITIPNSVTTMSKQVFKNCTGLTSITLSSSITSIPEEAFYGCSTLASIDIPDTVTSIGEKAFCGCSKLVTVTMQEGIVTIGTSAFSSCGSLTTIVIPASVTSIGSMTFYGCTNLENIYYKADTAPSGSPWSAPNASVTQLSE